MPSSLRRRRLSQAGFSLIELMVGLVIGLIAIIVVAQVFSLSEGFKRTTTGVDDATSNGAIALGGLQRDLRQSGHGMTSPSLSGCNLTLPAPTAWTLNGIAPVTINHPDIPAGDDNTDTLLVMYGNSAGGPEGERVLSQPATNTFLVEAWAGYRAGDRIVPVTNPPQAPCDLVAEIAAPGAQPAINVPVGQAAMVNGLLYNLGPAPRVLAYAVRNGNLTLCDYVANDCSSPADTDDEAVWVPIASNIVGLRAQYGRDTTAAPMDAVVDIYDQVAPATACERARISAVRVALVARSGQLEREIAPGQPVTPEAPVWSGTEGSPDGLAPALPFDVSGNPQWQNYRYRVFETTVPLRNMAWQGVQLGC